MHAEVKGVFCHCMVQARNEDESDKSVVIMPVSILESKRDMQGICSVWIVVTDHQDLGPDPMIAPCEPG